MSIKKTKPNKLQTEFKNLRHKFRLIKNDKIIITCWILSGLILFLNIIYLGINIKPVEFEIPVRYSSYSKVAGTWYNLFKIPGLGIIILLFNSLLSIKYYPTEKIVSYILGGITLLASSLLLIQAILFVYLIGAK